MPSIHPKNEKPKAVKPQAPKPAPKGKATPRHAPPAKPVKSAPAKTEPDFAALTALAAKATANTAKLSAAYDAILDAEAGKGFPQAVTLGKATGLTWDHWGQLIPQKSTASDVNAGELAIRAIEKAACQRFCTDTRIEVSRLLQLAVDASDPDVAKQARANNRDVPERNTANATAALAELRKLGNSHPKLLAAVDNPTELVKLGRIKGNLVKNGELLRGRLFMGLVGDVMLKVVPTTEQHRLGQLWRPMVAKAKAAQKDIVAKEGAVSGKRLLDTVFGVLNGKVIETLDAEKEAEAEFQADTVDAIEQAKHNESTRKIVVQSGKLYDAAQLNWTQYTAILAMLDDAKLSYPKEAVASKRDKDDTRKYAARAPKPVAPPVVEVATQEPALTVATIGDAA